ncbi:MAG: tetratricopeptide repeat protein [Acidobacteriaceae bacterium]|nr:tetratricopeptide repeat protein [Acidobacteriaceae bacterium]
MMTCSSVRRLILVFLACTLATTLSAEEPHKVSPVRQADAVCGKCHADILRNYLQTPMANASGAAADRVVAGAFRHAVSGIDYKISEEDGALWLKFSRRSDPPLEGHRRLDYFFGSGHLGITYLYTINGYLLESPVAYSAESHSYEMKPGLAPAETMPPALPMTRGCMRCHMSGVQREDPGTINHFRDLPFLYGGVNCESCHGDGREHVSSGGKASVINPVKLESERRDSICISCHLEGDTRIEHAGRDVNEFKPGDRIGDYVSYFVFSSDQLMSRGVSEIEQLSFSRCKRVSGNRMSCMSCHDPHYSPPDAEKARFYRSKCLACHSQPKFSESHFSGNPDCVSCHMPKGTAERLPHVAWTDHRIRRKPEAADKSTPQGPTTELVSFLNESASARDLALAYYDLVLGGNASLRETAWRRLGAVHNPQTRDLPVAMSLGYLAQMQGDNRQAITLYEEALDLDPSNVNVTNNLAILWARSGQLPRAEALWKIVFDRNEDLDQPGINLALAECMLGNKEAATRVLQRVLLYSPDQRLARRKLAALQSGQDACLPPGSEFR